MFLNETSNDTNFTSDTHFDLMVPYINSVSIILTIIFLFGIIFNIISILAILKSKSLKPINTLILNLALADIVYTLGIPLFVTNVFSQSWPFHLIGCQLFFLTDFMGMIVGVYTVAALSVERYIEVTDKKKKLEKYSNGFKLKIVFIYLLSVWLFAFLFSLPIILSIQLVQLVDNSYMCETMWTEFKMNIFFTIKFIFIFMIPFTLILFSSVKLLIFLKNHKTNTMCQKRALQLIKSMNMTRHECNTTDLKSHSKPFQTSIRNHLEVSRNYGTVSTYRGSYRGQSFIFCEDHKKDKRPTDSKRHFRKQKKNQSNIIRIKAIKIVLSIVLLFLMQWTPLWFSELYKAIADELIENIQLLNVIITLISYSNSISNPLLYIFLTHNFRKHLTDVLACLKLK